MEEPSARIVDRRVRNRTMDVVAALAEGDAAVSRRWPTDCFENVYGWIPRRDDCGMHPNSARGAAERDLLHALCGILDHACDAVPGRVTAAAPIATGCPRQIEPVALKALAAMCARGRFSEAVEENELSRAG